MTMDFQTNKRICEEVAIIPSKALKNKIAGYATVSCSTRIHSGRGVREGAGPLPAATALLLSAVQPSNNRGCGSLCK